MKYIHVISLTISLIIIMFSSTIAQEQLPMRGRAAERIEQFKKLRIMESLKMDEETSIRFFARYNKHVENMRTIGKNRNELIDQLKKLTQSDASDSDIEKVIKDIGMIEEKVTEARSKFIQELRDVLSVKKIAEFIVFERQFNQNLRELMRDITKERLESRKK